MASKYWLGTATAVAQQSTVQITAFDAATTYTITIGGVAVSVTGDTDVNTTASALQVALEASTHPYFSNVTWTVSTDTVTGTAGTAGVPFVATSSVNGGTGTIGSVTEATASAGPSDWSTADNWSDGAIPANTDTVIIANSSINISYGLAQSAVDLARLVIEQTYTGKIGLPYNQFTTSADGETTVTTAYEYRDHYLDIGADEIEIGSHNSATTPAGSTRIKIDNDKSGSSKTTIFRTANTSADAGFPAVRLRAANANADVFVREAKGGVGIALDEPNETSTVGVVSISTDDNNSKVFVGEGVTLTTFEQAGGTNVLNAAATVATVEVNGGTLTIEGDYTITALNINGGTVNDNHIKTSGNAVTTATITGGTLDLTDSSVDRTIATLNPDGGTVIMDDDFITVTTFDAPAGAHTISIN